MQMKLDWDLEQATEADVQSCLQLDQLLNSAISDFDSELFVNLGCSPPTLPSDDIWKKFGGFDEFDDIDELLKDVANLGWVNQACDLEPGKDVREIRNHDCMWAGHCASEKHEKTFKMRHIMPVEQETKEPPVKVEPKVVAVTTPSGTITTDGSVCVMKTVVAPTNARSVLIPARVVRPSKTLDSGGESPRPETPLSLSEDEELEYDGLRLAGLAGIAPEELDIYLEHSDEGESKPKVQIADPSIVTGQTNQKPEPVNIERHYTASGSFSDHCYHLSKTAKMDHLGVQTPSDSEEEIDVETVYGDSLTKKPHSRSSSSSSSSGCGATNLPYNPTLQDRQQIQLTFASAISKKETKRQSARAGSSFRYSIDDRTPDRKRKCDVRRTVGKKRCVQSEEREYGRKRKRPRYLKSKRAKSRRNGLRHHGTGSSDSELDSTEKRSLHNNMERQRRVDLRNAFEELRVLIPDLMDNQRAPKVLILSNGADYCYSLAQQDADLTRRRAELRRQQEMLRARVSQLRRSMAARGFR